MALTALTKMALALLRKLARKLLRKLARKRTKYSLTEAAPEASSQ